MAKGVLHRRLTVGPLLAALITSAAIGTAWAQTRLPVQHYDKLIRDSVARLARRTGILVDPRIAEQLQANARLFSGNLCGTVGSCAKTIESEAVLDHAVSAVLADMAARRSPIASLAQRLARSENGSMEELGWPTTMENVAAVVTVPTIARDDAFALQTASGAAFLGRGARTIIMAPGRSTLKVTSPGGAARTAVVQLDSRALASLPMQTQPFGAPATPPTGDVEAPNCLCADGQTIAFSGPYAFWNWGRGRLVESDAIRRANLMPFVSQRGVVIKVETESAAQCAGYCMRTVGIAFARAIAFWRSGCDRCSGNAFVTVRVGDNVWIDRRAADRLRRVVAGTLATSELDLSHTLTDEIQRQLTNTALLSPTTARVGYQQIDQDPQLLAALCGTGDGEAPWVRTAKALACQGGLRDAGPIRPTLRLRTDETTCGPAATFLACGTPGSGIEIALADSRFRFPGPRGPYLLVGTPGAPVFDGQGIVMHEVAHWFGVPHAERAGPSAIRDLMSATYLPSGWCVSLASLIMLNNAADRRWEYRVSGNSGLRRPVG